MLMLGCSAGILLLEQLSESEHLLILSEEAKKGTLCDYGLLCRPAYWELRASRLKKGE